MSKLVIIVGVLLGAPLIIFIGWMNLTPGHFQVKHDWCECNIMYIQDKDNPPLIYKEGQPMPMCYRDCSGPIISFKLRAAQFDFNK